MIAYQLLFGTCIYILFFPLFIFCYQKTKLGIQGKQGGINGLCGCKNINFVFVNVSLETFFNVGDGRKRFLTLLRIYLSSTQYN